MVVVLSVVVFPVVLVIPAVSSPDRSRSCSHSRGHRSSCSLDRILDRSHHRRTFIGLIILFYSYSRIESCVVGRGASASLCRHGIWW